VVVATCGKGQGSAVYTVVVGFYYCGWGMVDFFPYFFIREFGKVELRG